MAMASSLSEEISLLHLPMTTTSPHEPHSSSPTPAFHEYDFFTCIHEPRITSSLNSPDVDCTLHLGPSSSPPPSIAASLMLSCLPSSSSSCRRHNIVPSRSSSRVAFHASNVCFAAELADDPSSSASQSSSPSVSFTPSTHHAQVLQRHCLHDVGFVDARRDKIFSPFSRTSWNNPASGYHKNVTTPECGHISLRTANGNSRQLMGVDPGRASFTFQSIDSLMGVRARQAQFSQSRDLHLSDWYRRFYTSQVNQMYFDSCRNEGQDRNIVQLVDWQRKNLEAEGQGTMSKGGMSCKDGWGFSARICAQCKTMKTPLWRNGPQGPKSLCNACGIRYKKEERRSAAANHVKRSASSNKEHTDVHHHQDDDSAQIKRKGSNLGSQNGNDSVSDQRQLCELLANTGDALLRACAEVKHTEKKPKLSDSFVRSPNSTAKIVKSRSCII